MTINAIPHHTPFENEPVRPYRPGDPETKSLFARYEELKAQDPVEVPCVVGGERIFTGDIFERECPQIGRAHV